VWGWIFHRDELVINNDLTPARNKEVDIMQIGYDPDFIGDGIHVPLPTFSRSLAQSVLHKPVKLRNGKYSDHIHFTLVMNEHTKQLIYSAYNIDQSRFRPKVTGDGKRSWRNDKDIGKENQLDNKYYKDRTDVSGQVILNPYDRGHMVMRFNNMWGATNDESDQAGKATFIYANSSLQHENLNRDEWKALELNIVRDFQHDANNKLAVFTGPIFGDLDRHINLSDRDSARVPSGFFKVICFRKKQSDPGQELGVFTFAIFQDDTVLRDRKGGSTVKTDRSYQVTISELQNWTGINFGDQLYEKNPLFYHDRAKRTAKFNVPSVPERIPIGGSTNVVSEGNEMRKDIKHLSKREIIINSAMINPKGNETRGEWISLHNLGNRKTSITGWTIIDGHGRKAPLAGSIKSGESLRLKGKDKGKVKLGNVEGSLMLYDDHGCLIDHVTWSKKQIDRLEEGVAFLFANKN
jgi:endonuclease G